MKMTIGARTLAFAAAFAVPLDVRLATDTASNAAAIGNWPLFLTYVTFNAALNLALLGIMIWLFNTRWRVAG